MIVSTGYAAFFHSIKNTTFDHISGAQCRLILGKTDLDLTNSGGNFQLSVAGQTHTFENIDPDTEHWTLLEVRRRDGKMTAKINAQSPIHLRDNDEAIRRIGLVATNGRVAVRTFTLTGELQKAVALGTATKSPDTKLNRE